MILACIENCMLWIVIWYIACEFFILHDETTYLSYITNNIVNLLKPEHYMQYDRSHSIQNINKSPNFCIFYDDFPILMIINRVKNALFFRYKTYTYIFHVRLKFYLKAGKYRYFLPSWVLYAFTLYAHHLFKHDNSLSLLRNNKHITLLNPPQTTI